MKNFEKYASKQLDQYNSPTDTDKLWAGIDTQLRPRRKKRWLFLLLLPATGLAGLMLYYSANGISTTPSEAPMAHAITSSFTPQNTQKTAVAALRQAQPVNFVNRPSATKTTYSRHEIKTTRPNDFSPVNSESIYYKENTKLVKAGSAAPTSLVYAKRDMQPPAQTVSATAQEMHQAVAEQATATAQQQPAATEQATARVPQNEAFPITPTPENSTANTAAATNMVARRLSHTEPLLSHQKKTRLPKQIAGCYNRKTKTFTPFISIYGGFAFPFRQLNLKNAIYTTDYDKRIITENVLDSWYEGMTVGVNHRSGLSVEAGLHYQQINERFYNSQFVRDTMGSQLVITTIIHAPGDTSKFEEYRPIVRETTTTSERYNKYRFLSIPVAVTYERNTGGKWRPYIRAGALVNVMTTQSATIYHTKSPQKFDSGTKPQPPYYPFKSRVGVDLLGALGVRRSLSTQFSVFGEIRYQHPLYEITRSEYAIGQRYRLPGITAGGVFSF